MTARLVASLSTATRFSPSPLLSQQTAQWGPHTKSFTSCPSQWYRRAYFDDGTPLGSAANPECQIDAISQSWSVLSGAGTQERTNVALKSVHRRLVRRDTRLILLLDPPFDKSDLNPGYIKGYVPGVRENGGQYTHSAIWTVMAAAAMGNSAQAWEKPGAMVR